MDPAYNNSLHIVDNTSVQCTSARLQQFYSETFAWLMIVVYCFILFVGMVGNILTCMVVFIHKTMRRSIHFYMLNLAVSDSLILIIFIPTQAKLIYNQLEWNMGNLLCSTIHCIVPVCLSTSIGTLVAICIDRYSGVRDPFTWRIKSRRNAKITIPLIWIVSIGIRFPIMYYTRLNQQKSGECRCMWPVSPIKIAYVTTMMAIQYILPIVFIAGVYIHIVWIISHGRESINYLHRRVVKMVIMLLLTYLICSGMQYIDFYLEVYSSAPHYQVGAYAYIFSNLALTLQAAINPLIYSSIRDDFKQAFKSVITACAFRTGNMIIEKASDSPQELIQFKLEPNTEIDQPSANSSIPVPTANSISSARKKSSILFSRKRSSHFPRREKHSLARKIDFHPHLDQSPSDHSDSSDDNDDFMMKRRMRRSETLAFIDLEKFHERVKRASRKESRFAMRKCSIDYDDDPKVNPLRKTSRFICNTMFPVNIILGEVTNKTVEERTHDPNVGDNDHKDSIKSSTNPEKTRVRKTTRFISHALLPVDILLGRHSYSYDGKGNSQKTSKNSNPREKSTQSDQTDRKSFLNDMHTLSQDSGDNKNIVSNHTDDSSDVSMTKTQTKNTFARSRSFSESITTMGKKRRRKPTISMQLSLKRKISIELVEDQKKIAKRLSCPEDALHSCEAVVESCIDLNCNISSKMPAISSDVLRDNSDNQQHSVSNSIPEEEVNCDRTRLSTKPVIVRKIENSGGYPFLKFLRSKRNSRVLSILMKSPESPV